MGGGSVWRKAAGFKGRMRRTKRRISAAGFHNKKIFFNLASLVGGIMRIELHIEIPP
jgi:hypothetical protein